MAYSDRLRKTEWEVRHIPIFEARPIVEGHHYSHHTSNTATALHGLYRSDEWFGAKCYGVAWWIPPTRDCAAAWWPEPEEVLTLSRLVILPDVPKNAATYLLMRSAKMLEPRWKCLLTYADTWQGHTGHIYRAAGWEYLGLTAPSPVFMIDSHMVARKAGGHTRTNDEMSDLGAELLGYFPKHRFRYVRQALRNGRKKLQVRIIP